MNIRPARESELPRLMELFDIARAYMRRNGNTVQWVNGYPSEDLIRQDIAQDRAFVVEEAGVVEAVFCYLAGRHVEPTYAVVYGGAWPDDAPYGVIHRLASSGKLRGVMGLCADWALSRCPVLRVDTHESNATMRTAMARLGCAERGTIILGDETPRIAFQKRRDCPIRECRSEEDFRAAGTVLSEAWRASHSFCGPDFLARHTPEERTEYLKAESQQGKRVFTIENGGKVLGLVSLCGSEIGDLYVLPEAQGLGYGRLLLDFAVRQAPETPTLWLLENNTAAQRFYEDAGFTFTGRENRSGKLAEREMTLKG